jgi:hypothetical protein
VVSFTAWPLYPIGKSPLLRRLGASQNYVERIKSYSYGDSNSDPSTVQPVASRYIYCSIPALLNLLKAEILLYNAGCFIKA